MNELSITITGDRAEDYLASATADEGVYEDMYEKLILKHRELEEGTKSLGEQYVRLRLLYDALLTKDAPEPTHTHGFPTILAAKPKITTEFEL